MNKNFQEVKFMNRQSRRHPSSSLLPAFYPSKNSVIVANQKRKNATVNSNYFKKQKAKRGFQPSQALHICRAIIIILEKIQMEKNRYKNIQLIRRNYRGKLYNSFWKISCG